MLNSKDTGGPAFPQTNDRVIASRSIAESQGMTLRDYFATHAPKHDEEWERKYCRERGYMSEAKMIADWNYEYADAMLKAREQ